MLESLFLFPKFHFLYKYKCKNDNKPSHFWTLSEKYFINLSKNKLVQESLKKNYKK